MQVIKNYDPNANYKAYYNNKLYDIIQYKHIIDDVAELTIKNDSDGEIIEFSAAYYDEIYYLKGTNKYDSNNKEIFELDILNSDSDEGWDGNIIYWYIYYDILEEAFGVATTDSCVDSGELLEYYDLKEIKITDNMVFHKEFKYLKNDLMSHTVLW
jgi:hypothetical protein